MKFNTFFLMYNCYNFTFFSLSFVDLGHVNLLKLHLLEEGNSWLFIIDQIYYIFLFTYVAHTSTIIGENIHYLTIVGLKLPPNGGTSVPRLLIKSILD
jgi:hypothetical protein